jgi:hypothetical protein
MISSYQDGRCLLRMQDHPSPAFASMVKMTWRTTPDSAGCRRGRCSADNEPRPCKWGNSAPMRTIFSRRIRTSNEAPENWFNPDMRTAEMRPTDPGTEGRRRHRGFVCVGSHRVDFGAMSYSTSGREQPDHLYQQFLLADPVGGKRKHLPTWAPH